MKRRVLSLLCLFGFLPLTSCDVAPRGDTGGEGGGTVMTFYTHDGAVALYHQARYAEMQQMCEQGIRDIEQGNGSHSPQLAEPLIDLANLNLRLAHFPDAKKEIDRAESLLDRKTPRQALLLARLENAKGWRLHLYGETDASQKMYEDARQLIQANHPGDSLDLAEALNDLGCMYDTDAEGENHMAEAQQLLRESLRMRQALTGNESPECIESLSNVGIFLFDLARAQYQLARTTADRERTIGDQTKAIQILEKALDLAIKIYGENHPDTAQARMGVANVYMRSEHLDQAEDQIRQALAITTRFFGQDHPERVDELMSLGIVLEAETHYDQAEKAMLEAIAIDEKVFGPANANVINALNALESLYKSSGDEAKRREVRSKIEKLSGKGV